MMTRLPSGAVVRICTECAAEYPRHNHFCSRVASYSRPALLRELVHAEDVLAVRPTLLNRSAFWGWAWWLGLDICDSTREQRDDLRSEIADARERLTRLRTNDAA